LTALTRNDGAATILTGLCVLVYLAGREAWNVPLVGGSHRWAAGVIVVVGTMTCGLGRPGRDALTSVLATLGILALVLAAGSLISGALAPLTLLTVNVVALWALATLRHAIADEGRSRSTAAPAA
jgi:hypothetical protein